MEKNRALTAVYHSLSFNTNCNQMKQAHLTRDINKTLNVENEEIKKKLQRMDAFISFFILISI